MATYYWVGGNGTWDNVTTTNWSLTSGGSGGAGVPTTVDDVVFDNLSGTALNTVTIIGAVCKNFLSTISALINFNGAGDTLFVYGSFRMLATPSSGSFNVDFLELRVSTATGTVFQSVASFTGNDFWFSNYTGSQVTVSLDSNISCKQLKIEGVSVVPSAIYSINCTKCELTGTDAYVKQLGNTLYNLAINITPAPSTINQNVYYDNWYGINDRIFRLTVTLTPNSNKNNIYSFSSSFTTTKRTNYIINGGVTVLTSTGPCAQDITITNAEIRLSGGDTTVLGSFIAVGASTVTVDIPFSVVSVILDKQIGTPNISRAVTVPGTSQWINVGLQNIVSPSTDTITISGAFGTLANQVSYFTTGPASVGAGPVYAEAVVISNGASFSSTVLNASATFSLIAAAVFTGTYTLNTGSASISPNGGLIPNLNITGDGGLATLFQNLLVTNLSITAVSAKGGLQVRSGSSVTVSGSLNLVGSSSVNNVELREFPFGPAIPWSIVKTSGSVNAIFTTISYSNASGGASFQALESNGCVDNGNNTGWIFKATTGNFFLFL